MPKGPHATLLTYGLPQMPQILLDAWETALREQYALLTERLQDIEEEQERRSTEGAAVSGLASSPPGAVQLGPPSSNV